MKELKKRIITSIILFPILMTSIYYSGPLLIALLIFFYFICIYEIYKNSKNLFFNFFSNIVLLLAFSSFYYLRGDNDYDLLILCWVLFATFLSDIGGYIIGKIFKGKKLTKISPNKTYSGAFGSLLFSLLSIYLLNTFQKIYLKAQLIDFFSVKFFFLTILISLVCQLGDIFISFLKRKKNIKDVSNILPGHGGVIDRIDGLIFVLIFIFLIKKLI